jgi:hypothetical protein
MARVLRVQVVPSSSSSSSSSLPLFDRTYSWPQPAPDSPAAPPEAIAALTRVIGGLLAEVTGGGGGAAEGLRHFAFTPCAASTSAAAASPAAQTAAVLCSVSVEATVATNGPVTATVFWAPRVPTGSGGGGGWGPLVGSHEARAAERVAAAVAAAAAAAAVGRPDELAECVDRIVGRDGVP